MKTLTTFEDIFNKLIRDYQGQEVEINTKQDGVNIANFTTSIDKVIIKPLNIRQSKKWTEKNQKVGLIIIQEKRLLKHYSSVKIPFILGFDTMKAGFLKKGVVIKTLNMEFNIKKMTTAKKRLA